MAFDGITIANIVSELNKELLGMRISKIAQPENDELIITVKAHSGQKRLYLSASASLPLVYFTSINKPSPLTAPNFCMLLRKHIGHGRFTRIYQPSLERIIRFEIEHLNDLGDLCKKELIVEIMGKHSNIIFCDDNGMIIDSIKHISANMSSIREVLPGRDYFIPTTQEKANPLDITSEQFLSTIFTKPLPLAKAIYTSLTGISPLIAEEICYRSSLESTQSAVSFGETEKNHLYGTFTRLIDDVKTEQFCPNIVYKEQEPFHFAAVSLSQYAEFPTQTFDSVSNMLESYYAVKNTVTRIRQRSADLRRVVQTALERNVKKYDLQLQQLQDTEKRDKYKVYGELINTYGYGLESEAKQLEALNYYTDEMITIPLKTDLTPQENSKHYFDKYNKMKRTAEALEKLILDTKAEIEHLESIKTAFDIALSEDDLLQIKEELIEYGYLRRKYTGKKIKLKSKPFHYLSTGGYHIYVGKNNLQNEELTFKVADGGDWWFHAKGQSGSHVIIKTKGDELPDMAFEEAASLAAYYSSGRDSEKVEVDYIQRKHVKKGTGGIPGFVIYHTNYSILVSTNISKIEQVFD